MLGVRAPVILKVTGLPAKVTAGSGLVRPPDCVHADIEHLPLTEVRDDPHKSVFGKSHVNPPGPQCPGFVISHSDAVAAGQGQEDFDFVRDSFNPFLLDPPSTTAIRSEQLAWRAAGQTILNALLAGAPETPL